MKKPITVLRRMSKRGDQGFPVATLAFYGTDDRRATKAVLGVFLRKGDEATIYRWFSQTKDARRDVTIQQNIVARLGEHEVKSLVMSEILFGCPHEEGVDYPQGQACPQCPYWAGKDRLKHLLGETD